jgi:hypothetical protein
VAGWLGSGGSARAGWVSELRQGRPGGRGWKGGKLLRGLGERKVEDSYVRYPIPQTRSACAERRAPGGGHQSSKPWGKGGGHVLSYSTCTVQYHLSPESTFNHSRPGPARVRCGRSALCCLADAQAKPFVFCGGDLPGPLSPVTHPSKSRRHNGDGTVPGRGALR